MSLKEFFYPKSIVIIGASNKPGKVGSTLANKLLNFKGDLFYVNIEGYSINTKLSYKSLLDIKERIDLAVIAVPPMFILKILNECIKKRIKNIIIISSVFTGEKRKELENNILNVAKNNKIRILGPNNFGIVNNSIDLDCTFSKLSSKKGSIAFASQSGALYSSIADYSITNNFGISKFISFGDMIDIDFNEGLEYLIEDKETKVIVLYIETLKDGKKFMNIIKKSKKPIIVLKGGKTDNGKTAAHSHTGSLAGSYEIYKAASKQSGAFFTETLTETLDLAKFISTNSKPNGRKTLIITNAGGPGVLLTDSLVENNLEIVSLPKNLRLNLPLSWSHNNPIDVLGDAQPDRFKEVLNKIKDLHFYNILILALTPQDMTKEKEIASLISDFKRKTKKTIICCLLGKESFKYSAWLLENNNIPVFHDLERPAKLLKNIFNVDKRNKII